MIQRNSQCVDDYIYDPHSPGWRLSTLAKELTVATHVMHSSFDELSSSVSDRAKCKQTKFDTYTLIPELTLSPRLCLGVCHQPHVKLGGFRFRLGVSHFSLSLSLYIYIWNFPSIYENVPPPSVEVNVLDCNIIESEFELQSCHWFVFGLKPSRKIRILLSPYPTIS